MPTEEQLIDTLRRREAFRPDRNRVSGAVDRRMRRSRQRSRRWSTALVAAAVVAILSAVGMVQWAGDGDRYASSEDAVDPQDLIGSWTLVDITHIESGDELVIPDARIKRYTLDFAPGGQFSMALTCGSALGDYTIEGDTLVLADATMPDIGCSSAKWTDEDRRAMAQTRDAVTGALGPPLGISLGADSLRITDPTHQLVFQRSGPLIDVAKLAGTWRLARVLPVNGDNMPIPQSQRGLYTISMTASDTFSARIGCRAIHGSYRIEGKIMMLHDVTDDGSSCSDIEGSTPETQRLGKVVSDALKQRLRVSLEGRYMMLAGSACALDFRRVPDSPSTR